MQQQEQRFSFTGSGSEYFRIWIVNLFLTIITLGIYSAWAKVRRLQYFHRNTVLNDSSFDYHGDPKAILKGRIIAVGMLAAYKLTIQTMPMVGLSVALLIALLMPALLVKSFRFRLYNTSYRGLRFGFTGSMGAAYISFLLWPILSVLSLLMLAPFSHQRFKAYQHGNSRFGQTGFTFEAGVVRFYIVYFLTAFVFIALLAAIGFAFYTFDKGVIPAMSTANAFMIGLIGAALFFMASQVIVPYFTSRMQNMIWNNTTLGPHRFESNLSAHGLLWIIGTNFIGTILTLGLFKPFADVRMARYRIEHMSMQPEGDLDAFIAGEQQQATATGTETAEMFDLDFSF